MVRIVKRMHLSKSANKAVFNNHEKVEQTSHQLKGIEVCK